MGVWGGRSSRRHQPPPRSRRWTCRRGAGDPRSQPTAGMRRACPLASNSAYLAQSQLSSMKALMTAILDLTPGTAPKRQVHRRSTAGLRKANQRSAQTATPRGAARDGPCVTRPRIPSRARMTGHAGSCGVISATFYSGGGSLASRLASQLPKAERSPGLPGPWAMRGPERRSLTASATGEADPPRVA
jgi:hypothetical protein